jgi:hypothetical protein
VKRKEGDKGAKEEMRRREELAKGQQRTEEDRKKRDQVEQDDDTTKEVPAQTGKDDTTRHLSTPFDWATDVEESLGPIPVPFVDRAPDTASIIGAVPSASKPQATMSLTKPDYAPPKPTTAPSSGDVAPCAVRTAENETARTVRKEGADDMSKVRTTSRNAGETRTPSASVKRNADESRTPIANKPPSPAKPIPALVTLILAKPVSTTPDTSISAPAVSASTPPVTYPPRDFSGLSSGA